jgi:Carboxypeptidase regulatory-like domain/TonB dependent receptor
VTSGSALAVSALKRFRSYLHFFFGVVLLILVPQAALSQQTLGAITGTVTDPSGAVVSDATVKAVNIATNLEVAAHTESNGSFEIPDLPGGTYRVTVTKDGFKTETHTRILVFGNRTTTVDTSLVVGSIGTTVEVNAVPLMNQVNTTIGYVVDTQTIETTPLGTGSFTQLAILSPGVHADFLGGGGANTGLGNQAIFANGNRDTSNSFSLNGISTNNLFNGDSTSQVGENRFVLNTGENFGAGGTIQTSTSVTDAIGQALPTPPPDAIQEIAVNSSQYDASQGNNSGAHISVLTKSGTNVVHGSLWEQWQNSDMNANPFFYNYIGLPRPFLNRNAFGGTVGGPIIKDKLFFFGSYQGMRISDAEASTKTVTVPLGLTNDRSTQGLINMIQATYGTTITAGQIDNAASELLNAKLPNGQYLIPSAQYTSAQVVAQGLDYDAVVQGPNTEATVSQGIAGVDYVISSKDRLAGRYYIQSNPTNNPFGSVGSLLGFPQQLAAGSQVFSLSNSVVLSPNLTWEQHVGFTRLRAYAGTTNGFTPASMGITLPGAATFPQFEIGTADPTVSNGLEFGPSPSFGNGGMIQNQWEYGTSMSWVKGKHIVSVGTTWDHTQLNILNNNTNTDNLDFETFLDFVEGTLHGGDEFVGSAHRYYRANTVGTYINDNFKVMRNLTVTAGFRWDIDGPLTEKYGLLTTFDPSKYSYTQCTVGGVPADPALTEYNYGSCDSGTDVINNSGLLIAGNNKTGATPGANNSLLKNHQWGFAPRIGIAWSPMPKLTVRTGYGLYYDRGELFSYFSPSAGSGFNGPFGVTLAPPFVQPISVAKGATLDQPFGTTLPPPPPATGAAFLAYLPNLEQTACGYPGCWPSGNLYGPFLYGGYDTANKLPYTQNWTLDFQYQPSNSWMFEAGYVGSHGTHLVLPIPFNQPLIATSTNVVNGQTTSYGGTSPLANQNYGPLDTELIYTNEYAGNAPIRVPYPGYDMNAVSYKAEGISNFDALQLQVHKRLSNGLQFTTSYTWSHSLDEQSGLGLFFTGNNPATPRANYGSSDFDQTHVFLVNYSYTLPNLSNNRALGYAVNGWAIGGQTVAESGQPYSVYDYSGSVASLYYGTSNYIGNPIVPLVPGITPKQAAHPGANCAGISTELCKLNSADFAPQFVAPGTNGVPACDATGCDNFESLFGTTGRNTFRGPFQVRLDVSLAKQFRFKERYGLKFEADAFNIFNHPDFDAPNNDVNFFPNYEGPPSIPPQGSLGVIQHTVGSPRFLQLSMHFVF